MKIHELKTWPEFYDAVNDESKTFEIRKNDRDFKVGDTLILREWSPTSGTYTGFSTVRKITYITDFAQRDGHIVMGIKAP